MTIEFDVKLEAKDLFYFNMYQAYRGMQGIISIIISVLVFVMAVVTWKESGIGYTILYAALGFMFLFYIPVSLKLRSKQILKTNEVLAGTLHYHISAQCIRVTQGEEEGELPWDMIYKMISTKNYILIYSNRINAYIIPKEQLNGQYEELAELAKSRLEKFRVKMK